MLQTDHRRSRAARIAPALALPAIVLVVVVWDPLAGLARWIGRALPEPPGLPDLPDLPDLPGWLAFLLGPGKLLALVVIAVLVGWGQAARRETRRTDDEEEP